jgi:hypothetical protein
VIGTRISLPTVIADWTFNGERRKRKVMYIDEEVMTREHKSANQHISGSIGIIRA